MFLFVILYNLRYIVLIRFERFAILFEADGEKRIVLYLFINLFHQSAFIPAFEVIRFKTLQPMKYLSFMIKITRS